MLPEQKIDFFFTCDYFPIETAGELNYYERQCNVKIREFSDI